MYNLIIKEFLIQKKTLLYGFIYTIFTAYVFNNLVPNGGAMYTIAPFVVTYLFVNYSCGFDDKSKADIIFNSLPIKRDDIIISKYISVFFFAVLGIICSAVLGLIGFYTGFPRVSRLISIDDIVVVITGGAIFASIFYPLYFKFGIVKMKFANIFLFMLFMFLPTFVADYALKNPNSTIVKYISSLLINTPAVTSKIFSVVIACIILLGSLLISMSIYKNKDF